jgi:YD repeat-containing protein
MGETGLPRDVHGHPYQPVFYFDERSRPTRLACDADGRPLGYLLTAGGDFVLDSDEPVLQSLPDEVVTAVERLWREQVDDTDGNWPGN